MKKTVNINIAGIACIIDEDAYNMLTEYLNDIRSAFASTEYGEEISSDIEGRVAELISEKIHDRHIEVIDIKIVNEIIERIGRAEEYNVDEEIMIENEADINKSQGSASTTTPPPYECKPKKRLFRNPSDSMLGGVCSGLAQSLGIDTVWVRLAFVGLTIMSASTWIIVYIVLWICIPEATTASDYFAMKGECATIEGIGEHVQNQWETPSSKPKKKSMIDVIFSVMVTLAKAFLLILAIIAAPVLVGMAIALIVCIILLVIGSLGLTTIAPFELFDGQCVMALACAVSWIVFVGIPMFFMVTWILKSVAGASLKQSHSLKTTLLIIWLVSLIAAPLTSVMLI